MSIAFSIRVRIIDDVYDNPLDLSISLEGGKENNSDFDSSGERSQNSPDGNGASQL